MDYELWRWHIYRKQQDTLFWLQKKLRLLEELRMVFLEQKLFKHKSNWLQHVYQVEDHRLWKQI